jgi:hypothetical protein
MAVNTFNDMKTTQANVNSTLNDNKGPAKDADKDLTPVKSTERMSPQFSGYSEGRKPNMGGTSGKRSPHADSERR